MLKVYFHKQEQDLTSSKNMAFYETMQPHNIKEYGNVHSMKRWNYRNIYTLITFLILTIFKLKYRVICMYNKLSLQRSFLTYFKNW